MSRIAALVLPFLIPPLVFAISALLSGLGPSETVSAIVEQYTRSRQNLFTMALLGLFPMILMAIAVGIYRRLGGTQRGGRAMAWGAIAMVSLVLLWVNFEYWPKFFPNRVPPMWPHGLEFVIGPLFFAPVAMVPGMLAGWFLARRRRAS